ncbi:MAG: hypothetical protein NTX11_04580 [Candidatus Saccharibacteria bacterium]|nr:hypothetical protein [Candidatus Saccharibacteria bacterium]
MELDQTIAPLINNPEVLVSAIRAEYFGEDFDALTRPQTEIIPTDPLINDESNTNRTWREYAREAVIVAEAAPFIGGALRYGAVFGTVLASTKNPYLSAGSLGLSTGLVEGGAVYAASHLLTHPKGSTALKLIDKLLDSKFARKIISEDAVMPPVVEALVGLELGAPAVMKVKKREDLMLDQEQLLRKGLFTTSWLIGATSLQGFLIAEGLTNMTEPKIVGPILGVFAFGAAVVKKIKNKYAVDNRDNI